MDPQQALGRANEAIREAIKGSGSEDDLRATPGQIVAALREHMSDLDATRCVSAALQGIVCHANWWFDNQEQTGNLAFICLGADSVRPQAVVELHSRLRMPATFTTVHEDTINLLETAMH